MALDGQDRMPGFDVVVVPDFLGRYASVFEARTLFFIAAWLEHAGAGKTFPLHIACVGDPPRSVQAFAEQAGAEISIHQSMDAEASGTANKLRGLEVRARTGRVLLLDADVFVLRDISGLQDLEYGISVGQVDKPRLHMRHWRVIYRALGMPVPRERMASTLGQMLDPERLHLRTPRQNQRLTEMLPFYNSGVLFLPWSCGLRPIWEEHIRMIATLFKPEDKHWKWLAANDETGLATAVQRLKGYGVPFIPLPEAYHVRWQQVWGGRFRWGEPRLFHALGIFRMPDNLVVAHGALGASIREYCSAIRKRRIYNGHRFRDVIKQDIESFNEFTQLFQEELLGLLDAHVAPVLRLVASAARTF